MKPPPRWLRRAPLVREPLRRAAKRFAPHGPVTAEVEGLSLALHPRDNKTEFDIWYKARLGEAEERHFLKTHLSAGDVFVDIGANVGLYTAALLAGVKGLTALAIEPMARLRLRLANNLALNGLSQRATIVPFAVGPEGTMPLHESANAGRSSLLPFAGSRGATAVPVRPLADLLGEARVVPAAIKIDVEGFEAHALLPYFDAEPAERWPRAIVLETLHRAAWHRDCLSELTYKGYVMVQCTQENACLVRPS